MAHAVLTGPIRRELTLSDGTVVDVTTPDTDAHGVVYVETLEHAEELAHLVSLHYHQHGHPHHGPDDPPFKYKPAGKWKTHKHHADNKLKAV